MSTYHVEVVKVERVGADWIKCATCGCKYPPEASCPYQEYHDDPTQIATGSAEAS